jgi:hypothetical protein
MGMLDRIVGSRQDRFAREVVAELHRLGIPEASYLPEAFAVRYRKAPDDGDGGEVLLHNVFHECAGVSRAERRDRIRRLIAAVVRAPALPQSWAEVRPRLRPVLRSAQFGRSVIVEPKQPLSRPALPHLNEYVVVDQPDSMAYVTVEQQRLWGVPPDEMFAAGYANLARVAAGPAEEPAAGPAVLRFVDTGDAYFTSRLLLDGWLAGLAGQVGGRPVAFAPDRDTLIVVSDAPAGLPQLFELVEKEFFAAPRGLSPQAYTVADNGRVIPYPAPEGHPLAAAVHRADTLLAADEYAAQAEWLEQQHTRDNIDIFVATLGVLTRPDGTIFSAASWAEGVDTLLPPADFVAFTRTGEQPFFVPWSAVLAETDLEPQPGLSPIRYRVTGWPQEATLRRLRARATTP